ncbi:spore coat protein [Clostridiaceae bacterium M8S5]|nr:spore coat protein [Clostridiaceae bacterium M8S5]
MINFTQKQRDILKEQRHDEELCIKKYNRYASRAHNPQLSQLFTELASVEQQHYDTLTQMLNGVVPSMNQSGGGQGQGQGQQAQQQNMQPSKPTGNYDQQDSDLCRDALNTEKFISGLYNTAIFDFEDKNVRQVLNHIQKEEQEHGEKISNYMTAHGMDIG